MRLLSLSFLDHFDETANISAVIKSCSTVEKEIPVERGGTDRGEEERGSKCISLLPLWF